MRIGFARHHIRAFRRLNLLAGKSRYREIHGAPEKMYRAALAQKRRAELLEHTLRVQQNAPEILHILPVIRCVLLVLLKARLVVELIRRRVNSELDSQRLHAGYVLAVEVRYRTRPQLDAALLALARENEQPMADEIELYLEGLVLVRDDRSGQTARRNVKRHVPPVVHHRCKLFARLPYDLRPHVQRVAGPLPLRERQRRPFRRSQVRPRRCSTSPNPPPARKTS